MKLEFFIKKKIGIVFANKKKFVYL